MRVTERLAGLFIDENLVTASMLAQGTSQFLGSQVDDARRRLVEQEKKLEAYRRAHSGELPSQEPSNLAAINNAQMQVQSLLDSMARDRDQLAAARATDRRAHVARIRGSGRRGSTRQAARCAGGTTEQQLEAARSRAVAAGAAAQARTSGHRAHEAADPRPREERAETEALAGAAVAGGREAAHPGRAGQAHPREAAASRSRRLCARPSRPRRQEEERARGPWSATYQARADAAPTRETELIELMRDYNTLQEPVRRPAGQERRIEAGGQPREPPDRRAVPDPRSGTGPRAPVQPQPAAAERDGRALAGAAVGFGLRPVARVARHAASRPTTTSDGSLGLPVLALVPMMVRPRRPAPCSAAGDLIAGSAVVVLWLWCGGVALWVVTGLRSTCISNFYGLDALPFELSPEPEVPADDLASSRGAGEPAVRDLGAARA